jgi:hypothetical protein
VCTQPEYKAMTKYFYLFSEKMAAIWTTALSLTGI